MVVELYHSGQRVGDLSNEYDVSEVTIWVWIKKFAPMDLEDGSSVTPDDFAKLPKTNVAFTRGKWNLMAIFAKK